MRNQAADCYLLSSSHRNLPLAKAITALVILVRAMGPARGLLTYDGTGAEGGYASVTVADAAMTVSLDGTGIGPAAAVAAVPNAATAYAALTEVAHLQPGERVLVHGALGGLASAFPGVARTLGAAWWTSGPRSSRWPKPPRRTAARRPARSPAGSC
jgi:NADPH2:quinone reductase